MLHKNTPLIIDSTHSSPKTTVQLKMDCFQPAGSFKIRGIGAICEEYAYSGVRGFVSSSGGNAGLAVAYVGQTLDLPATIIVPSTTPESVRTQMRALNASVMEHGDVWDDSDIFARTYAESGHFAYIHPFDHPTIWRGHSSLIDELVEQSPKPDVLICSVGGGGLLCGIMEGLVRNGWNDVSVIAVETFGAASLQASVTAGRLVSIPAITSIAKTLGAKRVARQAFEWTKTHPIHCLQVSDQQAIEACIDFSKRFNTFVEPSCGAALAALNIAHPALENSLRTIVIVCGGNGVNDKLLTQWRNDLLHSSRFG